MKKSKLQSIILGLSTITISSISAAEHLPVIREQIEFTSINECTAPETLVVNMTHTPGTKTRNFSLPDDSPYGELANFSRWPSDKKDEMGYFTDQAVSRDKRYIVTISGRVSSSVQDGKTYYKKSGTWMDSKGCFGTWIDKEQEEHALTPLAACHVSE